MVSFFANPFVSLVVGAILSFLVAQYFYKRNFKSSLTPFIQFSSSPLIGLDPKLRNDLKIIYNEKNVDNLFEIQFLIANTGDKTIKTPIKPLTLTIPEDTEVLDAKILFINPEGRELSLNINETKNSILYNFPLLNSGDFFITKLLINGNPSEKEFKFTISAEELPPSLKTQSLPIDALSIKGKKRVRFEKGLLLAGVSMLLMGLSILKLIYNSVSKFPSVFDIGIFKFVSLLNTLDYTIIISIIPALSLILAGILLTIGSFTDFSFPGSKHKYIIPEDEELLRRGYYQVSSQRIFK